MNIDVTMSAVLSRWEFILHVREVSSKGTSLTRNFRIDIPSYDERFQYRNGSKQFILNWDERSDVLVPKELFEALDNGIEVVLIRRQVSQLA